MNRKKIKKLTSCLMAGMIVTTFIRPSIAFAEETNTKWTSIYK